MIVAAHQTMLAPQGAPLPYDAEVEYIATTGAGEYIDTGIVPANSPSAEIVAQYIGTTETGGMGLFGLRYYALSVARDAVNILIQPSTLKLAANYASIDSGWTTKTTDTTSFHTYAVDSNGGLFDGVRFYSNSMTYGTAGSDSTIYVCGINVRGPSASQPGPLTRHLEVRVSGFKFWNGGSLVFDGIPVRVGTTGYLFDRVSGQLFGNAGTGNFTIGPDKT